MCDATMGFFDELLDTVSEEDTLTILGRSVHYKSKGHVYKFELVYRVEVVDELSKITASADKNYSWHTSLRKALISLLQRLHNNGILSDISSEDLEAVAIAVTECVEEDHKCDYAQELQKRLMAGPTQTTEEAVPAAIPPPSLPPPEPPSSIPPSTTIQPAPSTVSFIESYISPSNTTFTALGSGLLLVLLSLVLYRCYGTRVRRRVPKVPNPPKPAPPIPGPEHVLTERDLPVLHNLLMEEAHQSFTLGLNLGLPVSTVRILETNAPRDTVKLLGLVLGEWLRTQDPPPTVEKLVAVLSGNILRNKPLANGVKTQYRLS